MLNFNQYRYNYNFDNTKQNVQFNPIAHLEQNRGPYKLYANSLSDISSHTGTGYKPLDPNATVVNSNMASSTLMPLRGASNARVLNFITAATPNITMANQPPPLLNAFSQSSEKLRQSYQDLKTNFLKPRESWLSYSSYRDGEPGSTVNISTLQAPNSYATYTK